MNGDDRSEFWFMLCMALPKRAGNWLASKVFKDFDNEEKGE